MRSVFYSAVTVSLLAAACGGDSSGPPKAGPPAALTVVQGGTQEGQAGLALSTPLTVKVVDRENVPVVGALVVFTIAAGGGSLSATTDSSDASGVASVVWTLGSTIGAARAEARVAGVTAAAVFNATVKSGPAANVLRVSNPPGTSAGGFELPDSVAIKVTDSFNNAVAGAAVTFAIASGGGIISPSTATTNADGIARANWTLGSTGAQQLRVSAGTLQTTVDASASTCSQTTIPVGGVFTIGVADPKCIVLTGSAQRYFVTVVNTAASAGSTRSFRVRGAGNGTATTSGDVASARTDYSSALSATAARERLAEARQHIKAHDLVLRANERVLQQVLPRAVATRGPITAKTFAMPVAPPNVGDTLNMRIPGNFANLCSLSGASSIRARVVYVGQHGVMLEDVAAPVAGQADSLYRLVGEEFDNTMWTILNTNYGNPLAMDPQTDNNDRFYMLFSKVVNDMQGGQIAGFVSSSDFFSQSLCPSSNLAEVFYARVPVTIGTNPTVSGSSAAWFRSTRTVMIHEVKHIVSFAERIKQRLDAGVNTPSGFNEADRWLEESSAMMAEELWARTVYGYQARENVPYARSVGCEVRPNGSTNPTYGDCGRGKPLSMFDHFILFYDYQSNVEGRSPIGAVSSDDFTFYGSGWSFLRWLIDTYAASEPGFLTALTREYNLPGVDNIVARTGRPFGELISDWAIAMALDDYPGFTPQNAKHQLVSWNTRDIFSGMSTDFSPQNFFLQPEPLKIRPTAFGKFAFDVSAVRGGSVAVFQVSGTQGTQQMFEFNGPAGSAFPADMRVSIVRVQ